MMSYMALDQKKRSICQYGNVYVLEKVKDYQDFHRLQGVYGVWGSFMNPLYYFSNER